MVHWQQQCRKRPPAAGLKKQADGRTTLQAVFEEHRRLQAAPFGRRAQCGQTGERVTSTSQQPILRSRAGLRSVDQSQHVSTAARNLLLKTGQARLRQRPAAPKMLHNVRRLAQIAGCCSVQGRNNANEFPQKVTDGVLEMMRKS